MSSQDIPAIDYCPSEYSRHEPEQGWAGRLGGRPSIPQLTDLRGPPRPSQGLPNQDSRHPVHAALKPTCFACNEQFSNSGSLSRHQKDKCEREMIAACELCSSRQAIYYTKERLIRHHVDSHGDSCRNHCSKKISNACRERLCNSFVKLPPKRAWGCPYCIKCFGSFEDRNNHCLDHCRRDDRTSSWSFTTMIWSLLQQSDFNLPAYGDSLAACNWSKVTEKTCPGFREVLERCKLPHDIRVRDDLRSLSDSEAVYRYILELVLTGEQFPNQQLFEVKGAPAPSQVPAVPPKARHNASCGLEPTYAHGNKNPHTLNFTYPYSRPDSATIPQQVVVNTTGPESQFRPDTSNENGFRAVKSQDDRDVAVSQTRRRGGSLKRTISLSFRQSSGKSILAQPEVVPQSEVVPQVPPLPDDLKSSEGPRAVTHVHHTEEWLSPSHADARPMSGVITTPSFFDND